VGGSAGSRQIILLADLAAGLMTAAMQREGTLAASFGWLVGVGPGAGFALLFVCTSLSGAAVAVAGLAFPAVRTIEQTLPDHKPSLAPAVERPRQPNAADRPSALLVWSTQEQQANPVVGGHD
jgi:hypothetical protein